MLVRLLLALLVAALPLPAMAGPACHAPPAAMTSHHGSKHEPAKHVAVEMLCLGCVAPATARTPALDPPLGFTAMLPVPTILTGLSLDPAGPATPPPRSDA